MTVNFQSNELEKELEKKAEAFFKSYDFKLEDKLQVYKLDKKSFFETNETFFDINCKYFSQKQRDIIYRVYANACEDRLMQKCKKEVIDALKKYQCYIDIDEDGTFFIGNACIGRYILF